MSPRPPLQQPIAATALLLSLTLGLALLGSACRPSEQEGEPTPTAGTTGSAPAPSAGGADTPVPLSSQLLDPPIPPAPVQAGPAVGLPQDRPLRAGVLVVDGVYNTELAAPYDVFHHTASHAKPGIQVFTVSPDGRPITTYEGLKLTPDHSFADAPAIDILVVPSTVGSMDRDLQNQALIDWVRRVGGGARHVLALCDGAFVLARAGLLEGVPATTFPDDYERFAQMFPNIDLRVNVSFVDAGRVLTSQGGAKSYEVAMHLVDKLYGTPVAQGIGKGLLVPWPPDPDTMSPRVVETPPPPSPSSAPPAPASPG